MKIIPFIINTVIAPHGITDIGHSLITNNSKNLLKIYGINFTFTNLIININHLNDLMIYNLFLFSIIHFRHDFKNININNLIIPNYVLSFITLFILNNMNSDFLIYYMALIHVPNHLNLNNFHIKKLLNLNVFLYIFTSIFCLYSYDNFNEFLNNEIVVNNIISIIISHIIYQELYILNDKNYEI